MLLTLKKNELKRTVGQSPKISLKQLKLWIPKPSAEEWNICSREWKTITIRSAILLWTHCLAEQHAKPWVWLNTVLVMSLAFTTPASRRSLASLGLESSEHNARLQSMRATSFNHADIFSEDQPVSQENIRIRQMTSTELTAHEHSNPL